MSYRTAAEKDGMFRFECPECKKRNSVLFEFSQETCPYCGGPCGYSARTLYDCSKEKYVSVSLPVIRTCVGVTGKSFFDRLLQEHKCRLDVGIHIHRVCHHCKMEWPCKPAVEK